MGNMRTWWVFGFEWWGGLRPAEMTTAKGIRYVPVLLGLWLRQRKKLSPAESKKMSPAESKKMLEEKWTKAMEKIIESIYGGGL